MTDLVHPRWIWAEGDLVFHNKAETTTLELSKQETKLGYHKHDEFPLHPIAVPHGSDGASKHREYFARLTQGEEQKPGGVTEEEEGAKEGEAPRVGPRRVQEYYPEIEFYEAPVLQVPDEVQETPAEWLSGDHWKAKAAIVAALQNTPELVLAALLQEPPDSALSLRISDILEESRETEQAQSVALSILLAKSGDTQWFAGLSDTLSQASLRRLAKDTKWHENLDAMKYAAKTLHPQLLDVLYDSTNPAILSTLIKRTGDGAWLRQMQDDERIKYSYSALPLRIAERLRVRERIGEEAWTYFRDNHKLLPEHWEGMKSIFVQAGEADDPAKLTKPFIEELYSGTPLYDFHVRALDDWENDSSEKLSALLKDSVGRQFDGEVVYHGYGGNHNPRKMENDLADGYARFPQKLVDEYVSVHKDLMQQAARIIYPDSETISLWRGTSTEETVDAHPYKSFQRIKQNPISSWTTQRDVAVRFAADTIQGIVLEADIPIDQIWSFWASHAVDGNEREFLIIGKDNQWATVDNDH